VKLLSIPADFAHRDEVKLLARDISLICDAGEMACQIAACHLVFQLWLDWSRNGTAHRAFRKDPSELDYLIASAVGWIALHRMLGSPLKCASSAHLVALLCGSGVLTRQDGQGGDGFTLTGFAEYNAHLHPEYQSMQTRGGIAKKRNARLRQAANDGAKQRTLLEQSGFEFPSDAPATEKEQNEALGYILQLHMAMDLPAPRTAEWSSTLVRDAIHIVRSHPADRLMEIASWIMEHRTELEGQDPEWFIRNFKDFARSVPSAI